jgi:hypothetical protein
MFRVLLSAAALLAATPAMAAPVGDEPIAVPRTIKQGIDFVYVDPQMSTVARRHQRPRNWLRRVFSSDRGARATPNPLFLRLADGLQQYRATWGTLPTTKVPTGPVLKLGSTGKPASASPPTEPMTPRFTIGWRPTSRSTGSARSTGSPARRPSLR